MNTLLIAVALNTFTPSHQSNLHNNTQQCADKHITLDFGALSDETIRDIVYLFNNYERDCKLIESVVPFDMNDIDKIEYPALYKHLASHGVGEYEKVHISVKNCAPPQRKCKCKE